MQGDVGDTVYGIKGAEGEQGDRGEPGPPSNGEFKEKTKVTPVKGATGSKGVRGDVGDRGRKGEMGAKGPIVSTTSLKRRSFSFVSCLLVFARERKNLENIVFKLCSSHSINWTRIPVVVVVVVVVLAKFFHAGSARIFRYQRYEGGAR